MCTPILFIFLYAPMERKRIDVPQLSNKYNFKNKRMYIGSSGRDCLVYNF